MNETQILIISSIILPAIWILSIIACRIYRWLYNWRDDFEFDHKTFSLLNFVMLHVFGFSRHWNTKYFEIECSRYLYEKTVIEQGEQNTYRADGVWCIISISLFLAALPTLLTTIIGNFLLVLIIGAVVDKKIHKANKIIKAHMDDKEIHKTEDKK